jgi:chromosome segregation ATPase
MRSPASEHYFAAASVASSPSAATGAAAVPAAADPEPYEIVSLRRELERARKDASELAKRVAAKNTEYLLREEDLSRAIREAAELGGTAVPNTDLSNPISRQRARAFRLLDDEENQAKQKRIAELEKEIEVAKKKVEARKNEEVLAGTAVTRLKQQVDALEKRSALVAAQVETSLQPALDAKTICFQHRALLVQHLSMELQGAPGYAPAKQTSAMEMELCPINLTMHDGCKRLQFELQQLVKDISHEAELQAAVFEKLENLHRQHKTQLEDQSEILLQAKDAVVAIQEKLAMLDAELNTARNKQKEMLRLDAEEGTLESLTDREAQLIRDLGRTETELMTAERARETAKSILDQTFKARKDALDRLAEEQLSLQNAEGVLKTIEKQREDAESDRSHIERSIRLSKDNCRTLEQERSRLREEIAAAKEEKAAAAERERKLEVEFDELEVVHRGVSRDRDAAKESLERKKAFLEELRGELEKRKASYEELLKERSELKQKHQMLELDAKKAKEESEHVEKQLAYARSLLPKNHPAANNISASIGDARRTYVDKVREAKLAQSRREKEAAAQAARQQPLAAAPQQSAAALRAMLNSTPTPKPSGSTGNSRPSTPSAQDTGSRRATPLQDPLQNRPPAQTDFPPRPQRSNAAAGAPPQVQPPASQSTAPFQNESDQLEPQPQAPWGNGSASRSESVASTSASSMAAIQMKLQDILARRHERGLGI